MRTREEIENFCANLDESDYCNIDVDLFESCIPFSYWKIDKKDIFFNRDIFNNYIEKYIENLETAIDNGFSIICMGDNGCGKTMFMSFILNEVLKYGYSAYYTTVLDMFLNFQRGMRNDKHMELILEMLESDFLVIDELSKEQYKNTDNWARTQIERILKRRYDNNQPTLIGSNADLESLGNVYGSSVESILTSEKYLQLVFDSGDCRKKDVYEMNKLMGYDE